MFLMSKEIILLIQEDESILIVPGDFLSVAGEPLDNKRLSQDKTLT